MPRQLSDELWFDPEYASEYTDDELADMRDTLLDKISTQYGSTAFLIMRNRIVAPIEAEIARREAKKRGRVNG